MIALGYLVIAVLAGLGLIRTLRSEARTRKYLDEGGTEGPLRIAHLSRPLQSLARDTRELRISLEGPLHQLDDRFGAALDTVEMDAALAGASRELADWMRSLAQLNPAELARLRDLGAEPENVRGLLVAEGWLLEGRRGWRYLRDRLERISRELAKLESRLQAGGDPYR